MEDFIKNAVETYQCPGCTSSVGFSCYKKGHCAECENHCAGTAISGVGEIFLGMPKGFNRTGFPNKTIITISKTIKDGWGPYDKFNVPCWKYLDEHGNTIVRGMSPRLNRPFLHVILENCIDEVDCFEITKSDIKGMD